MKAILILEKVSSSVIDYVHGGGRKIRRLVIKEISGVEANLLVNIYEGNIVAFAGYQIDPEKCTILGEIDVPEELVNIAVKFAIAKDNLEKRITDFEKVLNQEIK